MIVHLNDTVWSIDLTKDSSREDWLKVIVCSTDLEILNEYVYPKKLFPKGIPSSNPIEFKSEIIRMLSNNNYFPTYLTAPKKR